MSKKQTSLTKKLTLVEWCDQQVENGHELTLHWEGGNDSGWCYFQIDGESAENDYTEKLTNWMYDHLDYGSWAGEFSATGEATYDFEKKAFIGIDHYSETETMAYKVDIPIHIPKHLWFGELGIHVECNYDDTPQVDITFGISNGFLTEEHGEAEEALRIDIKDKILEAISAWENKTGLSLESIWDERTIPFSDFKVEGDVLAGTLEYLDFRYPEEEEKQICLDLKEILDEQD
mgnify:CR=1 FL=1